MTGTAWKIKVSAEDLAALDTIAERVEQELMIPRPSVHGMVCQAIKLYIKHMNLTLGERVSRRAPDQGVPNRLIARNHSEIPSDPIRCPARESAAAAAVDGS